MRTKVPIARVSRAAALAAACVAAVSGSARADDRLLSLGRHLAQECTSCHRIDGVDNGIPSIVGGDAAHFAETLGYYRDGRRNNPAMVSVAQSLDDEQIKALALYFSSLPKPPLAKVGKKK